MSQELWSQVDQYMNNVLLEQDDALDHARRNSAENDLPEIAVAPNQGKLLMMLAQLHCAKSILEIGTLGGYSTIWLARALPENGTLVTLELEPHHAKVAEENIAYAGFSEQVSVRVGRGVETLPKLAEEGHDFDFVFIDADKPSNVDYITWALKLTHVGSVIIVDNVVRNGNVINANSDDPSVQGTRALYDFLRDEPRLMGTAVQTVGDKGYDGFALLRVVS